MAARTITAAPKAWFENGPQFGSYEGDLGDVDLAKFAPSRLVRIAREKRWLYLAIATPRFYIAVCVVRLGYASNAFLYVFDKDARKLRVHASATGLAFASSVSSRISEGARVVFDAQSIRVRVVRLSGSATYSVDVSAPDFTLNAELDTSGAPPAISAIANLSPGHVNTTQKRALLSVRGRCTLGSESISLDDAWAAYDYTSGILERHTTWRWAFGLGQDADGNALGFNLVQGFVGEPECALFVRPGSGRAALFPLREGSFQFDRQSPRATWRVTTQDGAVQLRFEPVELHAETKNLGLVRSSFVQPIGLWSGTISTDTTTHTLTEVLGVAEDQDVVW